MVQIGKFIERIESVIGIKLIVGDYMKSNVVLYILNLSLVKLKDERILILPLSVAGWRQNRCTNFQVSRLLLAYYVKEKCVLLKRRGIRYDDCGEMKIGCRFAMKQALLHKNFWRR